MKKKLMALALVVALGAIMIIGFTLAYFTDTDQKTNVFTVGDVEIELTENFTQESKLVPGTKETASVEKEVFVTNEGSEDAYVRVHIAIPQILDDGNPSFDAGKNVLHFNNSNMDTGEWNWSDSMVRPADEYTASGNWNYYETTINGILYNVYVVTYETALKTGETTPAAMDQVYLDSKVTNADIIEINKILDPDGTKGWTMEVLAEGCQVEGFEGKTPIEALNTAFGTPTAAANPFNNYGK